MKGPENVHKVLAKPTEMLKLNQADLFVHSGLDAEPWRDNLLKGARNPRAAVGQPGNVDLSQGIEIKNAPAGRIDRSQGDVHAFGDPHYQLDPRNAQRMTATLAKAMIQADPANADLYREDAKKVVTELADLHKDLRRQLAPHKGLKIVTFHPAWNYFADAFDLSIIATIEPKPGITPSPAQVKQLIEKIKQENAKIIICETYSDAKLAQSIANETGAKLLVLPDHVNGTREADSYQNLFKHNVSKIIETLQ
jgi:zinc/manganese transport system substrate-binding protein